MSRRLEGCVSLGAMRLCDSAPDSSHVCDLEAAEGDQHTRSVFIIGSCESWCRLPL